MICKHGQPYARFPKPSPNSSELSCLSGEETNGLCFPEECFPFVILFAGCDGSGSGGILLLAVDQDGPTAAGIDTPAQNNDESVRGRRFGD